MLQEWFHREKQKMRDRTPMEILVYVWEYYKLWLIGLVCLVWFIGFVCYTRFMIPDDTWFHAVFANMPPGFDVSEGSDFYRELADYAGYDTREKQLVLDSNIYCKPSEEDYHNNYYDKLIALMDGGILDVLVIEEKEVYSMGEVGRLLDLQSDTFTISEKWADRLIWLENEDPEYGKDRIPIAVDLTGCRLTAEDGPYPGGCAAVVNAAAPRPEELETFLGFLFEEVDNG